MNAENPKHTSAPLPADYAREVAKNYLFIITKARACSLPINQLSILLHLFLNPGDEQKVMSKTLELNRNHLNNNIRLLLAKKLIMQQEHEERRYNKKTHFLTEAGRKTIEKILKHEHV